MASIGGLTSSTSSSLTGTNSLKGYGGLASGLDRDSLIEAMTSGTQSKIQKQKQNQQKLQWQQEAIRTITDKMYAFSQKFTSYSSGTNLISSSFFSRNQITSLGANAKYVSVTGNSSLIDKLSIVGVDKLATNAQADSSGAVSKQGITTGEIGNNLKKPVDVNKLSGITFSIKYGTQTYDIELPENLDYGSNDNLQQTVDSLNKALKGVNLENGEGTLADVMQFDLTTIEGSDGTSQQRITIRNKDFKKAGNSIELKSGDEFFQAIGVLDATESLDALDEKDKTIGVSEDSNTLTAKNKTDLLKQEEIGSILKKTSLKFEYNGEIKWIKIDKDVTTLDEYANELKTQLDRAFGSGKINVETKGSGDQQTLSFTTIDDTSVLSITYSTVKGVLGENGVLKLNQGESNRLDLNKGIDQKQLNNAFTFDGSGEATILINGEEISIKKSDSLRDIMNKINNSKAGVEIEYLSTFDKFVITSKQSGTSGQIKFDGKDANNFLKALGLDENLATTGVSGEDAVVWIQYEGSAKPTQIVRSSNSFKLDGLNISVSGTFNAGAVDETQAVTFDAKVDGEKVTTAVKEMIDAFNEIIDVVNEQVSSKQSASDKYEPLTDQQKAEMSEDQIKQWEEKAKVGILYNDTELRGLMDALRFVLPSGTDRQALSEIGITVSSNYSDNGKLTFDEEKFKAAMESDPDKVKELFTKSKVTDDNGNVTQQAGFMTNIKTVMDRYASTTGATKGILIERAGSQKAPTTVLKNAMQTQLDQIAKTIERLQETLESEQNRYINQFTQLETVISNMNAQSAWLSQLQ